MKGLILHSHEVLQLSETGIVTVVRPVKKVPCECGDWIPYELSATTPEGFQTLGHSGKWSCESCLFVPVLCPFGQPGEVRYVRNSVLFVECTGVKVEQINGVWSWLNTYKKVGDDGIFRRISRAKKEIDLRC
jgi:hypothetical protein